ncbi:MAG: Alanyl-tRNA synthetase [uncultured Thermomicrobiales bacterium]|uniref:Alanine--tRNA ligase n=1 Tax=uncultured Thermomicrobiales bacterium TaxID=1645740 RepID=A0A6J4V9S6_9BACT|nr:MAG: Alanyl-tRNA synthetase [uncultured Thermomicrobiales bacterium]
MATNPTTAQPLDATPPVAPAAAGVVDGSAAGPSAVEIRRRFVDFFRARDHREVLSSSLVPHDDPTVLLTTAGMQQMTPYFLGLETPPAPRMVSVQKCFRTVDIEEVGDESHCTFFFMLGNFSVGDYFKRESLRWSWEFLTVECGLDPARLWPTVHPDDQDSYATWRDEIGVPEDTIGKLADNWWGPVGASGPNGPDSEIYYDLGEAHDDGSGAGPGDNPRYLEVWNNVFMEFFQNADGSRQPLPRKNVDTGMGLERLVMVMQGADSIYGTDLYQPIIRRAASLAGVTYGEDREVDSALRVIADHARGGAFLIADGVLPGNEGRAYVLRRVLRRAVRGGRKIGLDRPFLAEMAGMVVDQFGGDYPELVDRRRQIERVLTHEEESFGRTLTAGIGRFQALAAGLTGGGAAPPSAQGSDGPAERDGTTPILPGEEAFRLYDTYGFPYDLTVELAREQGIGVDQAGFERAMAAQRETSRGGAAFKDDSRGRAELYVALAAGRKTTFLGYDPTATSAEATILALVGPDGALEEASAGQAVEVILDRTPFYAESGGQVGDTGTIRTETGLIRVDDTRRAAANVSVHRGVVEEGFVRSGEAAVAAIDAERRQAIRRNHTATHLLHRALRDVLGPEVRQAGSLVAPDRLRFDFTSLDAPTPEQLTRVVERVNGEVFRSSPVATRVEPYAAAVAAGAMALFGEKYGDEVRVVEIPGYSKELCGGTHVGQTGEIGPFLVTAEGSVAAGVRRVEALTGAPAVDRLLAQQRLVEETARGLRTSWEGLPAGVASLQDRVRAQERELERLRGELAGARVGELLSQAVAVDGTQVLAARVEVDAKDGLRLLGDRLRDRVNSGVVVLGAVLDGQPRLLATVTPDLVGRGVRAGDVLREAAALIGGRGGGRPDLAEAGGKDPARLDEALGAIPAIVRRGLGADA